MQLKPKESTFRLKSAKDKVFTMNPITLADEVWLDETYGQEKIQKIFNDMNIKEISRIVFRLLKTEDKLFFKPQDVLFVNENGESEEIKLGGVELLRSMVIGNEEKLALMMALLENIGISRPVLDELSKEEVKKKKVSPRKKRK